MSAENYMGIELKDSYVQNKYKTIITSDHHHIIGLGNISHSKRLASEPPSSVHYHQGLIEIHCIVKGARVTTLYSADGSESYYLKGSEALIIFPNEPHSNGIEQQGLCEEYGMQVDVCGNGEILGLNAEYSRALKERLLGMEHRHVVLRHESSKLIQRGYSLIAEGTPESCHAGVHYLACFLYELTLQQAVKDSKAEKAGDRISVALKYIEDNYTEPITLEELADVTGYSLSRFKAVFLQKLGCTPANYINTFKLDRAKQLLSCTDETITDIAYGLGWSSSNYFCSVFKKYVGTSPLQYRRRKRG